MGIIEAIFEGLQKVDLLKWVVTIAIPTAAAWLFRWFSVRRAHRAADKKRSDDLNRFIIGLPSSVKGLLEMYAHERSHTIRLNSHDQTVRLAEGLGIITVASHNVADSYYTIRGDIWDYLITHGRMSDPSDEGAEEEGPK